VYQQRYCALIDILGFSTHVLRTADDPDQRVKIWDLLAGARVAGPHVVDESRKEYRFHAFSDTLVLSDIVSVEGLLAILEGSIRLADSFFQDPSPILGAFWGDRRESDGAVRGKLIGRLRAKSGGALFFREARIVAGHAFQ
jgi:hypothetical protein